MAKTYTVTDVRERRRYTAGGQETREIEVYILTTHGGTGSVAIPASQYQAETLGKILEAKAAELELAFGL